MSPTKAKTATLKVPGASLYDEIRGSDGAGWQQAFQAVEDTWRREGAGPGMQRFITTAVRTGGPKPAEDDAGPPSQEQAPQVPDMSQMTPEMLEGMARMQANSEFFLHRPPPRHCRAAGGGAPHRGGVGKASQISGCGPADADRRWVNPTLIAANPRIHSKPTG
jgi:hypothetical protein